MTGFWPTDEQPERVDDPPAEPPAEQPEPEQPEPVRPEFYEWLKQNPNSEQPSADYWADVRATEQAVAQQAEEATGYRPLHIGALPPSVGCARCGAVVWDTALHDTVHTA